MTLKPLQPLTPITVDGNRPSMALVEVIQRLVDKVEELEARIAVLEGP